MADDLEKKAVDLAFDVTKQFITLALAGIAFVVGLSFNTPGAISSVMFWLTASVFGFSALFGLFFLMCGVSKLSKKECDVYASSLRFLSIVQILAVLVGVFLLVRVVDKRPPMGDAGASSSVEVRGGGSQQGVVYKVAPGKDVTIDVDDGKVKISTSGK